MKYSCEVLVCSTRVSRVLFRYEHELLTEEAAAEGRSGVAESSEGGRRRSDGSLESAASYTHSLEQAGER